jgi:DNA polymerase-3 subunit chi
MAAGCQVDFYVLSGEAPGPEQLACRLAMMAWEQGHRVSVRTESGQDARALDELMWEIPTGRFLSHEVFGQNTDAPVLIGEHNEEIPSDRDVVINLAHTVVPEPGRFTRLLEIVPARSRDREASRLKFRQYRSEGLEPAHHEIGKN